ncbi:HD domain-containing protein [Thermococcus paralvinellae]|uniref:5'-deoxynucleotidase n=1 Tax=Thermococcus paralvinellae TaxID=582419 RepID=W0I230_9EURY|nr:HD family hydrolase [Thermococcus paralvinellae]AHF80101.1 Metal-dependent phosphohydrolase, HD superfamily [Thermococcus paralvinellae]
MIRLFLEVGRLKRLPRMGWLLRGVSNPESVADHSFRVAFITLLLADELRRKGVNIDVEKALKIALLHDLGESKITDLPLDAQRYIDKKKAEKKAVMDLLLEVEDRGLEYFKLFEEYEEESSLEGRLVKFADKLEMVLQAYEYEKAGFRSLEEFWSALEYLKKSEFYKYFQEIIDEIEKLKKS